MDSSARTYSAAPPYPQTAVLPESRVLDQCEDKRSGTSVKLELTGNMVAFAHFAVPALSSFDDLTYNGLARRDRHVNADKAVTTEDLVATQRT